MEIQLGKFILIESDEKNTLWRSKEKKILLIIGILFIIGLVVAKTGLLDDSINRNEQYLYVSIFPIIPIFILLSYTYTRKSFRLTQQEIIFFQNRIIIKTNSYSEFLLNQITEIDFSYSGIDNGYYHPIFNRNPNHGNLNFISLKINNKIQRFEIYLPNNNEKIRIMNIIKSYKDTIQLNYYNQTCQV